MVKRQNGGGECEEQMERLIEKAVAQTAPTQTIRIEQAPVKVVTDSDQPPYKM